MPYTCCVPGCTGNYQKGPKVHVFSFPTDETMYKKWVSSIPRSNFFPTKHSKVCHLHFTEEDIIRRISQMDSRTGEVVTVYLDRPRLKPSGIPTQFGDCLQNIYNLKTVASLEDFSKDEAVKEIKEEITDTFEIKNEPEIPVSPELRCYDNYNGFLTLLNAFEVPKNWLVIKEERKTIIFKLIYSPGPLTSYAVVINSNLKLETFLYGQEISISTEKFKTPFKSCSLDQISELLEVIGKKSTDDFDSRNENTKCILNHVTNILGTVRDKDERISFLSDQLKLHACSKERYRYSAKIMIFASIMLTISPSAYQFLRHSGFLILPYPKTIKAVCNKFLTDPGCEENHSFPSYARNMLKFLSGTEKFVVLSVNEIDIKPYLNYKVNLITAYTFIISSICCNFREVVHIAPTSRINYESLHTFIKTIIVNLEEIGYRVFCVVCNVNSSNGKAMSNFANNKKLSIVYPHPVTNNRPLFFLYDPVHLLNHIKHDWLNSKSDQTLNYPDFETGSKKLASFQGIRKLYELERDKQLKLDYSLNLRHLFSSTQEEHDVSLIQTMFNPKIVQALRQHEKIIGNSQDTADFINIILNWWDIVNDNIPFKSQFSMNTLQEPVIATNLLDSKLTFLEKMLNWLDVWKDGKFSRRLSSQTHSALYHTTHGMLEITKYCFEELKLNYVLFNKFQTDLLEHRCGKYRHLDEIQYISVRQLYESAKRLIVHLLLTLKSPSFGNIPVEKFFEKVDTVDQQTSELPVNLTVSINEDDFEKVTNEVSVITYLASYCCYAALKNELMCEFCREKLVYPETLVVEKSYDLVENLKEGDLFYPHDVVVQIVLCTYVIFNNLLQNFEEKLFPIKNKLHLITQLVLEYVVEEGYLFHFHGCENHNEEHVAKIIITWVTNTFLKNYYSKNRLGKYKKRKLNATETSI